MTERERELAFQKKMKKYEESKKIEKVSNCDDI